MNCAQVCNYRAEYFNNELSIKVQDEILYHIIKCDFCHKAYIKYAKNNALRFDLIREVLHLRTQALSDELMSYKAIKTDINKDNNDKPKKMITSRSNTDKWVSAHNMNDFSELMNIKAIRDVYKESQAISEHFKKEADEESYRSFISHITRKICQKIDHLEKCLKLAEEDSKNA